MIALVAHLIGQDSFVDLSSGSSSSLSPDGTRQSLRQLHAARGSDGLSKNEANRCFAPALSDFQGRSLFTRYFEKQGGYQSQRDLALVQWMMAHISRLPPGGGYQRSPGVGIPS